MLTCRYLSILLVAVCSIAGVFGRSLRNRKAVDEFVKQITYTGKTELSQEVTLSDKEAMFVVKQGMDGVIDYEQKLFIFASGKFCHVAKFDITLVPSIAEIKQKIEEQTLFEMPLKQKAYTFRNSRDQSLPPLLPLAEKMCQDKEVVRVELVEAKDGRMKREVGVGEVVVIIIAIVLLGFLG